MGNLGLWINFGIPLLCTHKDIFTLSKKSLMKVTREKLLLYMLKTDFQPILVDFWCGYLGEGGGKNIYFEIWGGVAPVAPWPLRLCILRTQQIDTH